MKKVIILLPLLIVGLGAVLLWASAVSSYSADNRTLQKMLREQQPSGPQPRVTVDEAEFDFGTMDPLTMGSHEFVIRNDGDAALTLREGSTTCKCTVGEITRPMIPPGESGSVRLTWNTGRKHPVYSHGATILTNDFRKPTVDLRVSGLVRMRAAAEPAELLHPQVEPDRPSTVSTVVYSQIWTDFRIEEGTCSLEGAMWHAEAAGSEVVSNLGARSAQVVTLTVPAGMPEGFFQGTLNLSIRPEGSETLEELELPVSGKVLRRLAVYGAEIDFDGSIDLGQINACEGRHCQLLIKVRDESPELGNCRITTSPDFLQASVAPYQTNSAATGLYRLTIEIPADVRPCVYLADDSAWIRIEAEHSRIAPLELPVRFAIHAE